MADQFVHPAAIARHFGTWEGESVNVDTQGNVVDKHKTKIEIGAKGNKYSQRNTYTWPDGKTEIKIFLGEFDSTGKLIIQMPGNSCAECRVINDNQVIFIAPSIHMIDIITVCPDQNTRHRTIQERDSNGMPWVNRILVETHVSNEDVYFD